VGTAEILRRLRAETGRPSGAVGMVSSLFSSWRRLRDITDVVADA